jgi:hypothetical protein
MLRSSRVRFLSHLAAVAGAAAMLLGASSAASAASRDREITVGPGQTLIVSKILRLNSLTLRKGGTITAPAGYSLTMTVDGVETGQKLTSTSATTTAFVPGIYQGNIVLTPAVANPVAWQGLTFPFRQALYVDAGGVERAESVYSGVLGGSFDRRGARGITLLSNGQAYDGVYVNDGTYTLRDPWIVFRGNRRSDFIGDGAAIVGNGSSTRLVVDDANIDNRGAVRTGVVANTART